MSNHRHVQSPPEMAAQVGRELAEIGWSAEEIARISDASRRLAQAGVKVSQLSQGMAAFQQACIKGKLDEPEVWQLIEYHAELHGGWFELRVSLAVLGGVIRQAGRSLFRIR